MGKQQNMENCRQELNPVLMQQLKDWNNQYKESLIQNLLNKIDVMSDRRKSVYIIVCLLNGVDFHGYSTRTIYEAYYDLCLKNDIQNIYSNIEFSRLVCELFGYEVVDRKRKGKKYRVFKKVQDGFKMVQDKSSR